MSSITDHKSPTWCTIFNGPDGCYHIDWGHEDGPPLDFETVEKLSKKYLEDHPGKATYIWFIIAGSYIGRFDGPEGSWINYQHHNELKNHGETKRRKKARAQR